MSTFAFVLLCIQACLLQNVFGQCFGPGPYGANDGFGYGYGAYGAIAEPFAAPFATGPIGAYGGAGIGEVAVAGELPVAGTTLVAGQVPILGAVEFGGPVCASGTVSIAGSCGCGCAGPYGTGAGACAVPYGYGPADLAASHGPGLTISSSSPIIPAGVSVISENAYEGTLAAGGAVPLLGTVALEGALPTIGVGVIAYDCGNGAVAITAEEGAAYGYGPAGPYGYAGIAEPFGYGYGLAGPLGYGPGYAGCGCGALY